LTALETFGFPFGMIRKTRQVLGFLMVAVALCASSLHGYSTVLEAFGTHAHGSVGAHAHHAEGMSFQVSHVAHDHGLTQDLAGPCEGASCEEPNTANHCAYMHTHCCISLAIPAGDCILKLSYQSRTVEPERAAHLPLGELSNPLFRPPRASV
jgi:hypothetical protein